ncbi:ribonuclease domain-containing protein [Kibdelosporangium phytohabitans]|uniref:Ribonuclease n=1 Tax=Kibdelosporangium phytohabitans TaxID=860235 RepID=A0A0N9I321_9PSEU|nr:ribonuclease [Kibdelosporangium phytohabitans]ALG13086.1 ribonuclease [Kibdelosporangium phytohabitans]MBE1464825.1 ribonuclease T1 [Kibdelosporangium phytohabitans]
MTNITLRAVKILFALVIGLVGVAAPAGAGQVAVQAACGDTSGFTEVNLSALPSQATDTVRLIQKGGPYPFKQDGTVFQNREKILPLCSTGYYHEYTVKTPGSSTRGARRIVTGNAGEYFYTADHYASFKLVDIRA